MLSLNICIHFRIYLKITTYFEKKIEPQRFCDFYLSSCWHHRRLVGFKHLGSPCFMYFSSKLLPYLKWAMNFFFLENLYSVFYTKYSRHLAAFYVQKQWQVWCIELKVHPLGWNLCSLSYHNSLNCHASSWYVDLRREDFQK